MTTEEDFSIVLYMVHAPVRRVADLEQLKHIRYFRRSEWSQTVKQGAPGTHLLHRVSPAYVDTYS